MLYQTERHFTLQVERLQSDRNTGMTDEVQAIPIECGRHTYVHPRLFLITHHKSIMMTLGSIIKNDGSCVGCSSNTNVYNHVYM